MSDQFVHQRGKCIKANTQKASWDNIASRQIYKKICMTTSTNSLTSNLKQTEHNFTA